MQQCAKLNCTNDRGLQRDAENSALFWRSIHLLQVLFSLKNIEICLLVIIATRVHPVTSRTRKLRSSAPMVLGGQPPGRVGHCQETFSFKSQNSTPSLIIPDIVILSVRCEGSYFLPPPPLVSSAKLRGELGHAWVTFTFNTQTVDLSLDLPSCVTLLFFCEDLLHFHFRFSITTQN